MVIILMQIILVILRFQDILKESHMQQSREYKGKTSME